MEECPSVCVSASNGKVAQTVITITFRVENHAKMYFGFRLSPTERCIRFSYEELLY